jgi:hypothetical protein
MTNRQGFCVAGGWESTRDAEHDYWAARALIGCGYTFVCTTFEGAQRVVVSGADDLADLPDQARFFAFPGVDNLVGTLSVGDLLLLSAIDEVRALAGAMPSLDETVDTQSFVRPRLQGGRLVLTVQPGIDGYVPFEQPNPTPCCADHNVRHEPRGPAGARGA